MGLEIPSEFGYVILTGVSSAFVIMYKVILNFLMDFCNCKFVKIHLVSQLSGVPTSFGQKFRKGPKGEKTRQTLFTL